MISPIAAILKRPLWVRCLIASLTLHALLSFYFYTHPFLLRSNFHSLFKFSSKTPETLEIEEDVENEARSLALAQTFQRLFVPTSSLQKPFDALSLPEGLAKAPTFEDIELPLTMPTEPLPHLTAEEPCHLPSPSPLFENDTIEPLLLKTLPDRMHSGEMFPKTSLREPPKVALSIHTEPPLDASILHWHPVLPKMATVSLDTITEDKSSTLTLKLDTTPKLHTTPSLKAEKHPPLPTLLAPLPYAEKIAWKPQPLQKLEVYDLPDVATGADWHQKFYIDLAFTQDKESDGYLFTIDITPKESAYEAVAQQHFYFVLDRSHTIQKHKFSVYKRAVLKALASMQSGESFNIYFLDRKGCKMSPQPLPYSMDSLLEAENFLSRQEVGTPFVSSSIYGALDTLLSDIGSQEGVHTAIILTDGHTSLRAQEEQKALKAWLTKNHGRLCVYTAAVGQKNNLVSLDLLSTASGGKLLYSDTHASFPRKVAKLVIDLHDPLIYDVSVAILPQDENAIVTLSQASSHLPALYAGKPYRIVGKIDTPCDFELLFTGRNQHSWITLHETISFDEGEKMKKAVSSTQDRFHMHQLYAKFLREGGKKPLNEAEEILKKSHDAVAFDSKR